MPEYYIQDISENLNFEQFQCLSQMYQDFQNQELMGEINIEINTKN